MENKPSDWSLGKLEENLIGLKSAFASDYNTFFAYVQKIELIDLIGALSSKEYCNVVNYALPIKEVTEKDLPLLRYARAKFGNYESGVEELLLRVATKDDLPFVIEKFKEKHTTSPKALARINTPEAIEMLIEAANQAKDEKNPELCVIFYQTLAESLKIAGDRAVPALSSLIRAFGTEPWAEYSKVLRLTETALDSLKAIGTPKALSVVREFEITGSITVPIDEIKLPQELKPLETGTPEEISNLLSRPSLMQITGMDNALPIALIRYAKRMRGEFGYPQDQLKIILEKADLKLLNLLSEKFSQSEIQALDRANSNAVLQVLKELIKTRVPLSDGDLMNSRNALPGPGGIKGSPAKQILLR